MAGVVGADHHHRHPGLDVGQITVSQSPDDMLSTVAADSKVDGFAIAVVFLPDVFAPSFPALSDGIADKGQFDVSLSGIGRQLSVSCLPARLIAPSRRKDSRVDVVEFVQIDVAFLQPFQN